MTSPPRIVIPKVGQVFAEVGQLANRINYVLNETEIRVNKGLAVAASQGGTPTDPTDGVTEERVNELITTGLSPYATQTQIDAELARIVAQINNEIEDATDQIEGELNDVETALRGAMGGVPGQVLGVTIVDGGAGYTSAPTVVFGAPPDGGTLAEATAGYHTVQGVVDSVDITEVGGGYVDAPTVTFEGGGGDAGKLLSVSVTNPGSGYGSRLGQRLNVSAPPDGGTQAQVGILSSRSGRIGSIYIVSAGSGYVMPPTITAPDSWGGSGFTATATLSRAATGTAVLSDLSSAISKAEQSAIDTANTELEAAKTELERTIDALPNLSDVQDLIDTAETDLNTAIQNGDAAAIAAANLTLEAAKQELRDRMNLIAIGRFRMSFDDPIENVWDDGYSGTRGTITYPDNGRAGGKAFRVAGSGCEFTFPDNLIYNEDELYRMRARVRLVDGDITAGVSAERIWIGLRGYGDDGTTEIPPTTDMAPLPDDEAHWYCVQDYAFAEEGTWYEVEGYTRGSTLRRGTMSPAHSGAFDQPAPMPDDVKYMRPVFHIEAGSGDIIEVDYIYLEVIPIEEIETRASLAQVNEALRILSETDPCDNPPALSAEIAGADVTVDAFADADVTGTFTPSGGSGQLTIDRTDMTKTVSGDGKQNTTQDVVLTGVVTDECNQSLTKTVTVTVTWRAAPVSLTSYTDRVYILSSTEPSAPTGGTNTDQHTPTGWTRVAPRSTATKDVWFSRRTVGLRNLAFDRATSWGTPSIWEARTGSANTITTNTDRIYRRAATQPDTPSGGTSSVSHLPTGWSRTKPSATTSQGVWRSQRTRTYTNNSFTSATTWGAPTQVTAPTPVVDPCDSAATLTASIAASNVTVASRRATTVTGTPSATGGITPVLQTTGTKLSVNVAGQTGPATKTVTLTARYTDSCGTTVNVSKNVTVTWNAPPSVSQTISGTALGDWMLSLSAGAVRLNSGFSAGNNELALSSVTASESPRDVDSVRMHFNCSISYNDYPLASSYVRAMISSSFLSNPSAVTVNVNGRTAVIPGPEHSSSRLIRYGKSSAGGRGVYWRDSQGRNRNSFSMEWAPSQTVRNAIEALRVPSGGDGDDSTVTLKT